ncbi:MAG: hypothetical protein ACKVQS_05450 [Fimbriimonadaceae bacterium]
MTPTPTEQSHRDKVIAQILADIKSNTTIFLPDFDPNVSRPSDEFALLSVGIEPNPYGGTVGHYRYQFEGEEDLLHLIIVRTDGETLTPTQAQIIVDFIYPGVPPALMWFKAGSLSHHFYLGHDVLLEFLDKTQSPAMD